jgi:hypothetical protein
MATTAKRTKKSNVDVGITEPEVVQTVEATEEAFDKQNEQALAIMIDNAVKQYSVTDAAIADMKHRLSGLTVTSVEDKEGYDLVKSGWQEVRNLRIAVEHKRKALNRNAIDYKNAVDGEAKRITVLLEEIEEPLKERKEWFDLEKARIKAEAERKKAEEFVARTSFLLQRGFQFNGSMYVLDTLHVTTNQVREFEDAQWAEVASRAESLHMQRLEAQKRAEVEKQAQEQAQQAEMAAMIQERYESRTSWLQSKGFALADGQWMCGDVRLGADVSVRDYTKEAWQAAVKDALAKLAPAPVQQVPAQEVAQPAPFQTIQEMPQTSAPAQDDVVVVVEQVPTQVPVVESFKNQYENGFRACQALIITKFHDGQQRSRAQWIELIQNLQPSM